MTRKLNKRVDFVAKDAEEQTATGAVLVPDELDRQGDFLRPEDVENLFNEDVDDGVMHARFPDDAAETSHRLLNERIDRVANSEADTDQTAKGTDNAEGDDAEGLDAVAKLLG